MGMIGLLGAIAWNVAIFGFAAGSPFQVSDSGSTKSINSFGLKTFKDDYGNRSSNLIYLPARAAMVPFMIDMTIRGKTWGQIQDSHLPHQTTSDEVSSSVWNVNSTKEHKLDATTEIFYDKGLGLPAFRNFFTAVMDVPGFYATPRGSSRVRVAQSHQRSLRFSGHRQKRDTSSRLEKCVKEDDIQETNENHSAKPEVETTENSSVKPEVETHEKSEDETDHNAEHEDDESGEYEDDESAEYEDDESVEYEDDESGEYVDDESGEYEDDESGEYEDDESLEEVTDLPVTPDDGRDDVDNPENPLDIPELDVRPRDYNTQPEISSRKPPIKGRRRRKRPTGRNGLRRRKRPTGRNGLRRRKRPTGRNGPRRRKRPTGSDVRRRRKRPTGSDVRRRRNRPRRPHSRPRRVKIPRG